ncbi:beta-lactamase/transpeptidase-like protein [Ephemerocybe angulata]|uniref:Beta-lactamase/transpeptidase-like protein n=1 Tax=Ephemerocybe angulata TaxID=980116 RepID=A0A8H6MDN4_9AGAR|nr:beta-lactamase/transpeptidase-like protein [Tulosesus angulatus]
MAKLPWILLAFLAGLSQALHFEPFSVSSLPPISFDDATPTTQASGKNSRGPLISKSTSTFIENAINEWDSTGLSVAVVQRDAAVTDSSHPGWRIEYGSYGVASTHCEPSPPGNTRIMKKNPITPDTLFAIASNSKLFLAISVGLLVSNETLAADFRRSRGVELGWRTKMRDIFGPDLWQLWDEDAERGATIQDLLSHRIGLPRHDYSGVQRTGGLEEMIRTLQHLRPSATFRETFQYNNLMYETLSYLPTLLLNQTYESYIAQHLFEPLNMTSSTYSVAQVELHSDAKESAWPHRDLSAHMAQGHLADKRDFTRGVNGTLKAIVPYFWSPGKEKTWAGAGGVITSARDLSTWVAMLLNGGRHPFTNATIVPPEVIDFVAHGRSVAAGKADFPELSPSTYGAGQFRYSYRGTEIIEHGGNNPGFKSQVARFPEHGLGVVTLSNDGEQGGFVLEAAKWRIVDELVFGAGAGAKRKDAGKKAKGDGFVNWTSRYHKLWDAYKKSKKDGAMVPPSPRVPPSKPFSQLSRRRYAHVTYGSLTPCRVPPNPLDDSHSSSALLAHEGNNPQQPLLTEDTLGSRPRQEYENPHANCTAVLSLPSTRRILAFASDGTGNDVPETYITPFQRTFGTHLLLRHWSGDLFNVSVVWTNDDRRAELGLDYRVGGNAGAARRRAEFGEGVGLGYGVGEKLDSEDEGAMMWTLDESFTVEWVTGADGGEEGLAFRDGFWGKEGLDSREPEGWGRDGAEVWFEAQV